MSFSARTTLLTSTLLTSTLLTSTLLTSTLLTSMAALCLSEMIAQQTSTYSGEVYSASGKLAGEYTVEISNSFSNLPMAKTALNSSGRFEFDNVPPGSYTIAVKDRSGNIAGLEAGVNPASGSQIRIMISEPKLARPVQGLVSVAALEHHPPRKALKEMAEARKAAGAGDSAKEMEHLKEAIRIDPDFSEAHTNLGARYVLSGEYQTAYSEFQTALNLGRRGAKEYCNLAAASLALNRLPEAEAEVRKALAVDSRHFQANYLLGRLLMAQPAQHDEAIRHLKLAAAGLPAANVALAQVYALDGHKEEAISALKTYQQENPKADREKLKQTILSLK